MKRPIQRVFVLAVGIVVIMLIAGCEEQNVSSTKKSRTITDENIQLKEELERCGREVKKQKELLEECFREKKLAEERADKGVEDMMNSILKDILKENRKLRKESESLKAQVEQLKKEVEELKKEPALEVL